MRFARWTFALAGIYGLLTLIPHYFLEGFIARTQPPAITHPEFYYGFVGLGIAFQVLFLLIATDPLRLRPAMLAAVVEKLSFVIAAYTLVATDRAREILLVPSSIDLLLAILFVIAYARTAETPNADDPDQVP